MRSTVQFLQRHSHSHSQSHSSHVAGLVEAQMLMVESKQNRGRLAATSSPLPSPSSTVKRAPSLKGSEEWHESERIDLLDLKARIVKKVGAEKANRYFSHFKSFISSRLSKPELDKLVVITIGKENVGLHNQFVKAILSNAVKAKAPPPPPPPTQHAGKPPLKPHSPCITSDDTFPHASPSTLSNGDSFLPSPRHGRLTVFRDHRASPLGPREDHSTPDLSRPAQQLDGAAKQLDVESVSLLEHPLKRARVIPPTSDESASIVESGCSQSILCQAESLRIMPPLPFGSSIKSALGVQFRSETTDVGWRRPALHAFPAHLLLQDGLEKECEDMGDLPNDDLMHRLMEQAAASEGLEGVSRESAMVLNLALDAYLNRLIQQCVGVSGIRASSGADVERPFDDAASRDKAKETLLNMKLHRGMNGMCVGPMAELLKKGKEKMQPPLSLTDFKAAMDSNPQQLGEHWPVQLEKISFRIFDQ